MRWHHCPALHVCEAPLAAVAARKRLPKPPPQGSDAVSRLFALALISLTIAPARAADIAIKVRVVDETNAPVAGVRVQFSPHGTPEVASSDAAGGFEVNLPSAGRYLVEAAHEQFFPLHDHPVEILDQHELLIVLNHQQEQFDSVKVTDREPEVDLDRSYTERSLSGTQILDVPVPEDRYLRNSFRLMPGVVQDNHGGVHFAGGAENQVLYTLDGFNIGDPVTGAFGTRLSVDAVRSVEYSSGDASAEAGRGSAGMVAIQTKTGDDRLRYTATNFIPGVDERKGLRMGAWSPRLGMSAPLRRGRVWFSDNADLQYLPLVIQELPKGKDTAITWQGSNLARLQANLKPANIFYGSFLVNYLNASNNGLGPLDPLSTTTDRRARSWFFSGKDQIYLGHGALFEVGYGDNRTLARQIPQGDAIYQMTPLGRSGNYFVNSTQTSERKQLLSKITLPPLTLLGKHQVVAGIDLDTLEQRQDAFRTGFEQYNAADVLLYRTKFNGPSRERVTNAEASWYLMDGWTPRKKVRVEYGVRQDWDRLAGQWALAPRASISYAPWSHTRLSAGYAVSHDETSLLLFSRPFDPRPVTTFYSPDGTPMGIPSLGPVYVAPRGLGNGSYHNLSVGVERRLSRNLRITSNVLRKRGDNGLTYISNRGTLALAPFKKDVYDSADIAVHHTVDSLHEWSASYTRSRTLSNAVEDVNADQTRIVRNNFGRMGWDVPDRLLSWGYLPTPLKRWSVAYLVDLHEGSPFSEDRDGAVVGGVNSQRFPTFFELGLHLEYRLTLFRRRLALRAGFNNITGHNNPTAVNATMGSPNFLKFYGSDGRRLVIRLRALGKE
ncbi:MAG TPA: TonB-dependent receptor [Candidatus Acidoferrales bacterium]|nr:TonB-dependent receptor [Candidatus Acidoferrales bacterium]